uniref:Uncharacterized protein n=1 Tax=Vannella robusta TaxID=1487602 RepID=A0A7S4HJL0_9EUKA
MVDCQIMWSTKCPKPIGLRCDCFIQYCTLMAVYIACAALFIMGTLCLMGIATNGEGEEQGLLSTCLGLGSMGGWLFLLIGSIFPCCYTCCFIVLGEGGRGALGLKNTNEIPE